MGSTTSFLITIFIYAAFGITAIVWMAKRKKAGKTVAVWVRVAVVLMFLSSGVSLFTFFVLPPSKSTTSYLESPPQEEGIALGAGNFDSLIVGNSYSFSFCVPDSARSGATCGGLAGATQSPIGGSPPYSLMKGSGFFPPGMSLELNGLLSGSPTTPGTYNFQICAKDLQMNQGCQNYTLVVGRPKTSPTNTGKTKSTESDITIDSVACTLAYQDNDGRRVFNVSASGMAKGPVGAYVSFGSSEPDERYTDSDFYSILTGTHSEIRTGSWTNGKSRVDERTSSNARAETDPPVTSWEMSGRTVHLYAGRITTMTRLHVNMDVSSGSDIRIYKDITCSL